MRKILLLTDFSSGYSRSLLKGIVKYSKEFGPWTFYRMPLYYRELHGDEGVVKWAKEWGADAIIAQLTDVDLNILHQLNIPIIVQNYKTRHPAVSNLTGDYFGTGKMAAEFFLQKGYRNFAYYGFMDTVWMRERGNGFRSLILEKGYDVCFFNEKERNTGENWSFDAEIVSQWLIDLPKPVALFACDDYFALQITEVCKMYQINVPEEIAVLGVDNDVLLCNISNPMLSSIELDVQNGGYEAGRLLHQFLEKKVKPPINIIINPIRIVLRGSTEQYATLNKHIRQILKYIDDNYMNTLSVKDIIRIVPFSRRVLEKKFKEETGITIYQYIQKIRVNRFADLLVATNLSLIDAAAQAGFEDYKNVSRIFFKIKNLTPLQYRKKYKLASVTKQTDEDIEPFL